MNNTKKTVTKYLVTIGVAALATLLVIWLRDLSAEHDLAQRYRILADAFCVPGVILMCFSGIMWVSADGFFDSLGYAFSRIGGMFMPAYKVKHETYFDYKQRKNDKRAEKEGGSFWFLFFVGLGYVLVSVVFTVLYEMNFVG